MKLNKHWAARLDDYVIDLAWSPDGTLLAAASSAGPVSIFAADGGGRLHILPGHDNGTNVISFPAAGGPGSPLATGGQDGSVKLWDAAAGQHTATAALGTAWVEHLAWRPGSEPVLAAAAGRKISFLNPDGSPLHALPDSPKTVSALAWQPAPGGDEPSALIAIACFGHVRLIDAFDYSVQRDYPYANGIHALVWSPDGKWLVSGNQDPSVHLWIPAQDIELQMSGYEGKVKHLSFDLSSRWLATAGGRDACVWDCSGAGPEGRAPGMFPHDFPVCAVAFQNTHGLLATASQGGEVQIWSPERQQPLRATVRLPDPVTRISWAPDDSHIAIGTEKGGIYILACES